MPTRGLRVAFDMDGTVADMHAVLTREAARLFGPVVPAHSAPTEAPPDVPVVVARDPLDLDREQLRELWAHVERIENFWTLLPEIEPGIVSRIAAIATARQWDVLFITTRPRTAGAPVQVQTQRWLRAHGFEYPSVCVLERSRGRLADVLQLDAVVDDRPENCTDVAIDSKAKPLLIWPPDAGTPPAGSDQLGIHPVTSISEALAWLEAYDDRRSQPSLAQSVRRFFGRD